MAPFTRIWIFLNLYLNFFLADSNIFTSTRSFQIEFARPHVSGFTLSSSANLESCPRLMRKFYLQSPSINVSLTKLSYQALVRFFNLFMASNSSVQHGKNPQNGTVIIARFNCTHVVRLKIRGKKLKKRNIALGSHLEYLR